MKLSDLAIRRSITTIMAVLLVVLLGLISFNRLNLDLLPNINFPGAAVITEYPGVGPEEVETLVTRPLENALSTVTNLKSINSISSPGQSVIILEFNWGTDMDFAMLDMREKADLVSSYLPDEVEKPMMFKFDPSLMPILQLGVTGNFNLVELKKKVEEEVIPRLERLEGVASVDLVGGRDREILIELDKTKMDNYGISFSAVSQSLMMENLNLSGGEIERGKKVLLIKTTGKFKNVEDIRQILIPYGNSGGLVKLKEIGTVKDTFKEMKSIARVNKRPSIGLLVQKQTDSNTVKVTNRVKSEINELEKELKGNITITPISDQAKYIEKSIGNVLRNAVIGGLMAVIILFVFLRNIRSTIIIATAIPISIITTFSMIYFGGLTLNIISLGGLALGVGMLVDNSIVVLENIYRLRQEGLGRIEAASSGSQEVGKAILASTLTTIIVFLPVVFVEGLASQLFKELALTISFSLIASLLVALSLIPMLSSKMLGIEGSKLQRGSVGRVKKFYISTLDWSLGHRWVIITILIIAIIVTGLLIPGLGSEFLPEADQGEFSIRVTLPVGTVLEETDSIIQKIEEEVIKIPEVSTVFTNIGVSGDMNSQVSPEVGSVLVRLVDLGQRDRSTVDIMEELRNRLIFPDVQLNIQAENGFMGATGGKPVVIRIKGDNLKMLEKLADQVADQISRVEGIREVEDSFEEGRPEVNVVVDRSLAAKFGLRNSMVASAVRTAIRGDVVTRYEVDGDEYDIRIKLKGDDSKDLNQLRNLTIPTAGGGGVPLYRIADFVTTKGPKEILRDNQVRYAEVSASLYQTDLGTAMESIKKRLDSKLVLPTGYEVKYGGQFQDLQESFASLFFAFLLALVLVYMVMASQFESLIYPFIIMFTVPMALIGAVIGLIITGKNLSVPAIIGVITLSGIVVNNAIVLVDYINTLRDRGKPVQDAILEAGPVRLRPIMMTALTTILGLIPLALGIGEGSELQAPLAIVIISGLIFSTFLTLYVVPVLYSLFTGFRNWFMGKLFKKRNLERGF